MNACAHLQELELGAAAALQRWGVTRGSVAWQSLAWHQLGSCLSPTYQQGS